MKKQKKLIELILEFEDRFNPMQFYCRMREVGLDRDEALERSRAYSSLVYAPIIEKIKKSKEYQKYAACT